MRTKDISQGNVPSATLNSTYNIYFTHVWSTGYNMTKIWIFLLFPWNMTRVIWLVTRHSYSMFFSLPGSRTFYAEQSFWGPQYLLILDDPYRLDFHHIGKLWIELCYCISEVYCLPKITFIMNYSCFLKPH